MEQLQQLAGAALQWKSLKWPDGSRYATGRLVQVAVPPAHVCLQQLIAVQHFQPNGGCSCSWKESEGMLVMHA
jgi:hypothetical protein